MKKERNNKNTRKQVCKFLYSFCTGKSFQNAKSKEETVKEGSCIFAFTEIRKKEKANSKLGKKQALGAPSRMLQKNKAPLEIQK